jgi:hypothetical protein
MRRPRNMAQRRKQRGVEHVIWSTLEDTRKWVPLDDDRMPTLMGKYKVPHFDAKGEADRRLHRARRADDLPADVVLLGQPDPLRHGARSAATDGVLALTLPMGDRSCPASPPRTSASAPTASSSAARSSSARPSASPAST